uniref:Uncharacterized protein n=1 Tax=Nelumbo nucifera TaxID=4432 RepID=A0A822ZTE7_NELNU|nr:TPA_asm: hypothetical protein HUJ06_016572 [Nelumbo nucifera]
MGHHIDNEEHEVIHYVDMNVSNVDLNVQDEMFDYKFSEDEVNDGDDNIIIFDAEMNEKDIGIQIVNDNGLSDNEPISEYESLIDSDDNGARHVLEVPDGDNQPTKSESHDNKGA